MNHIAVDTSGSVPSGFTHIEIRTSPVAGKTFRQRGTIVPMPQSAKDRKIAARHARRSINGPGIGFSPGLLSAHAARLDKANAMWPRIEDQDMIPRRPRGRKRAV